MAFPIFDDNLLKAINGFKSTTKTQIIQEVDQNEHNLFKHKPPAEYVVNPSLVDRMSIRYEKEKPIKRAIIGSVADFKWYIQKKKDAEDKAKREKAERKAKRQRDRARKKSLKMKLKLSESNSSASRSRSRHSGFLR